MTTKGKKMKKNKTKMTQKQFKKNESSYNNFKLGQEIAKSSMEKLCGLAPTAENDEEAVNNLLDLLAGFLDLIMIFVSTLNNKDDSKRLIEFAIRSFNKALEE